ncbi:MAG: peptide-methionine (R)-S-oxide reductase MsrB [Ignavibacteriaceae bacterium]
MKPKKFFSIIIIPIVLLASWSFFSKGNRIEPQKSYKYSVQDSSKNKGTSMEEKIIKTEEEWKKELTPEQFHVLREKGTERPFTGEYDKHFEKGVYKCAACGNVLFESDTKFDSGCGWPSFFTPLAKNRVVYKEDRSYGMVRTEVMCAKCGGHLGHVFDDGPEPTGQRYCMNSVSLKFEKKEE